MGSKYSKRYSEEFKRDAIALVASSGRTVTEVARELGISSESLRGWVKKANGVGQSAAGAPVAAGSGLDAVEREELKRLRKLATDQARTIEILKKGTGRAERVGESRRPYERLGFEPVGRSPTPSTAWPGSFAGADSSEYLTLEPL